MSPTDLGNPKNIAHLQNSMTKTTDLFAEDNVIDVPKVPDEPDGDQYI